MRAYYEKHVICEFEIPTQGFTPRYKCELVKAGHNEGSHRMKWRNDHWGDWVHQFRPRKFAWATRILKQLQPLHGAYMAGGGADGHITLRQKATLGHRDQLGKFYSSRNIFSNRICLGCLFNTPTIRLKCGHIICYDCALDFGRRTGATQLFVDTCPLHSDRDEQKKEETDVIQLDPAHAGLRVLVLDG